MINIKDINAQTTEEEVTSYLYDLSYIIHENEELPEGSSPSDICKLIFACYRVSIVEMEDHDKLYGINPYSCGAWIDAPFNIVTSVVYNFNHSVFPWWLMDNKDDEVRDKTNITVYKYEWTGFDESKFTKNFTLLENHNVESSNSDIDEFCENQSFFDAFATSLGSSVLNMSEDDAKLHRMQEENIAENISSEYIVSDEIIDEAMEEASDNELISKEKEVIVDESELSEVDNELIDKENEVIVEESEVIELSDNDKQFDELLRTVKISEVVMPTSNVVSSTIINKFLYEFSDVGVSTRMIIAKRTVADKTAKFDFTMSELREGRLLLISLMDYGKDKDKFKDMLLDNNIIDDADRTIDKMLSDKNISREV